VLPYEMPDLRRFPRVQAFVSDGRLGKRAKAPAGERYGTTGTKIGKADVKWAFSAAAVLCLRPHPAGQRYLARVEKHHGQGKALRALAHELARAAYQRLKRQTAFDLPMCLQRESGVERVSLTSPWTSTAGA
jgi:transposase